MARFIAERVMRFGDCDPSGIAYYPRYLDMLNGVVEEWWRHIGHPWTVMLNSRRIGAPTVHFDIDFRAPSFMGDALTFTLAVEKLGTRSLTLGHAITSGPELRWSATQVVVGTSLDTHKAIAWPDDIRAAIQTFSETDHA